ncbi:SusC/RagA family TonB-linked outer membrane protein [Sunxiuqinia elliptica]|uniref:TonB-linked outer membrane protein, SusC/RagA family n=1 Tax=Sunxiuqinia elliptica TaxID=655355 RepID=A0A1I2JYE5_9BACT|nr:TonB-dependent receptor [Sunxiuqinia elliptica]SFF59564.1 TonB-linked outer membrane protein, SusC/RagA family [Sunxiuqinia elliptica]
MKKNHDFKNRVGRKLLLAFLVLFVGTSFLKAQPVNLTGTVSEADTGTPLPGVSVFVKGTTIGTITDVDGAFALQVNPQAKIIVFSFVGMKTQEIAIGNNKEFNVSLENDAIGLDEVVAVGYGSQKKLNLTGALSSVAEDELKGQPANNVASLLQGRMPGVTITQNSGQPGKEGITIRIRGVGTMNNSDPMVLVDGLEASMNDVNPADIESITTLKDASAASIYGTRAANGVILITTKRGKKGEPKLNYSGYAGFQNPLNLPSHLSSYEYAKLLNEGLANEGKSPQYSDQELEAFKNGQAPNTDWLDLLLQGSGFTHNHNLSITGGSNTSRYMISLAYYNQKGLVKNTNQDRYTARINFDSDLAHWLKFGINSSLSRREIVQPTNPFVGIGVDQFFRQANRIPNAIANKNEGGQFIKSHVDGNPIAWIEAGGQGTSMYSHALGSTFLEMFLADGLSLKTLAGVDYTIDDGRTHIKTITYAGGIEQGPNSKEDYLGRTITTTLQATLTYEKTFGNHAIKALLGASKEKYASHVTKAYRKNFPSNALTDLNAGSSEGMKAEGSSDETALGSYFGRINYDYKGKYLFESTLRRDASSKFAPDVREAFFPSFSAGWRISEETFLKQKEWLDNLKLRGSWGQLGNHRTDSYQYLSTISAGQGYPFGNVMQDGASQTTANNPSISWETTTEWNVGVDAAVFDGLFSLGFDYYDRLTEDILTKIPVSAAYGLEAPVSNIGAMSNKGVELQLGHQGKVGALNYAVSAYGTYNKNEVVTYPNPSTGDLLRREGDPWEAFYGYECIGKFQTDEEASTLPHRTGLEQAGDLRYKDQNNDGVIDSKDKVVIGTTQPKYTYGFTLQADYKQFDFSAFFQGAADVYRTFNRELMWGFIDGANAQEKHLDRTIVENGTVVKDGYFPRVLPNNYAINSALSTFSVMRSDYLRLKNITLGYTIPATITKNKVERARIYFNGQNLFTLTNFSDDADPEVSSGYASYAYPQVKTFLFGIDITF